MKIPVVLLFLLLVFLVPNPVVPDEALAADVEAETPGGPSAQQQEVQRSIPSRSGEIGRYLRPRGMSEAYGVNFVTPHRLRVEKGGANGESRQRE